jgi:hypothetical protein
VATPQREGGPTPQREGRRAGRSAEGPKAPRGGTEGESVRRLRHATIMAMVTRRRMHTCDDYSDGDMTTHVTCDDYGDGDMTTF